MKKENKGRYVKDIPKSFRLKDFTIPLPMKLEDVIEMSVKTGKIRPSDLGL